MARSLGGKLKVTFSTRSSDLGLLGLVCLWF